MRLSATHIVGGEITYRCLGNDQYEITLAVYRDCFNGVPWFDNPAILGIYDANWTLVQKPLLPWNVSNNDTLPIILTNPCLTAPPNVCVHTTRYTTVVTLPFQPGGYTFVYQRCCRNKLIRNIPDPLNTGISITGFLSEETMLQCNSSATFTNWPPVAICINEPIDFDHGATDPDGDSLVYRLCTPLNGPDSLIPAPNPPFPGPYQEVVWLDPPYNLNNVLGGNPLIIDAMTGFMTGIPNTIGNFVVGVCVDEYRNGEVISTTRRDFQYNVADCGKPFAAFFAPEILCDTLRVKFTNESVSAQFYRWYFDWGGDLSLTSTGFSPIFTYPDTGVYTVALIAEPNDPCSDTMFAQIHVTETFADADLSFTFPDCTGGVLEIQATDQSTDPVFGIASWEWNLINNTGMVIAGSSEQNPAFNVTDPGNYVLTLVTTSGNGCPDSTAFPFDAPFPPVDSLSDALSICAGDTIELFPSANPAYTYVWSPSNTLSAGNISNPSAFPVETTVYNVLLSGNGPCTTSGSVTVEVLNPGTLTATASPITILLGETSQLEALFPGAVEFVWSPESSLSDPTLSNPLASPTETTTYTVGVLLSSGCFSTDTVTVRVISPECIEPYVFFPTGFSPNGDGENDVLKMESKIVDEVYWVIFNRWGEKIFEADSIDDSWDGTYLGEKQPVETYGYYFRVRCRNGLESEKKGNVSLLR